MKITFTKCKNERKKGKGTDFLLKERMNYITIKEKNKGKMNSKKKMRKMNRENFLKMSEHISHKREN